MFVRGVSVIKGLFNRISRKALNRNMNRSNLTVSATPHLSSTPRQTLNTAPVEDIQSFKVLPSPTKSAQDTKDYRVIRLANGLTVCLISDLATCKDFSKLLQNDESESEEEGSVGTSDETSEGDTSESEAMSDGADSLMKSRSSLDDEEKLAAAALSVGVGSFTDPKQIPGMAHLLEHMVFMGSAKFPQENDFDSFLKKKGGSDNAKTEWESTTFFFECFEKHLLQALDKFAQFFISPLMKRESMTRERESIDSEFQLAVPSDAHRTDQLLMGLAKKNSPVNKFAWGNLITLRDKIGEDVLYEVLHQFRKRHYSAHRMTLAIQARLPLDLLQDYVLQCFSDVPNNNLPPENFSNYEQDVFNTPEFTKLYYVKPVKDVCQVTLTWMLPSLLHFYKSKPHVYVSWLLGHEGKGSLLSYLKRKVWALSVASGSEDSDSEDNCFYTTFPVSIVLTKEGLLHIKEVIEAVFAYLKLLKTVGPQEVAFKEMQLIHETLFRFQMEQSAMDFVEGLAQAMQYYPSEDYLTAMELLREFDPKAISEVMDCLTPRRLNVMILTPTSPPNIAFDQTEPWFQTKYGVTDIPEDWLTCWENVQCFPELILPEPNRFLTDDFSLLPATDVPDYPELIVKSALVELWYKGDKKFRLPNAYYRYHLIMPLALDSSKNACMNNLLSFLLMIELAEMGYDAQLAELDYSILSAENGIIVSAIGYNQKLPMVIDMLANSIKNAAKNINADVFEAVKEKQMKNYHNTLLRPSKLAKDVRLDILENQHHSLLDKYSAVKEITFQMMLDFIQSAFSNLCVVGLVQGNVSKEVAVETTNLFIDTLKCNPVKVEDLPTTLITQIPLGERCCRVRSLNTASPNSITVNYYQCGPLMIKDSVALEYIALLIEEPLFDILRTKEQLGYSVYSTIRETCGILGFTITVDSQVDKFTAAHVDDRIEAFIKFTQGILKKLTEKQFEQTRKDLLTLKKCADIDLLEEFIRNWGEINERKYMFDRVAQEIKVIEALKIGDIRKCWQDYVTKPTSAKYRKLSVQVEGHFPKDDTQDESTAPADGNVILEILSNDEEVQTRKKQNDYFIVDIASFKKDLYLYPDQTKLGIKEIKTRSKKVNK